MKRFGVIALAAGLVAAFVWVALTQGPMAPPRVVLSEVGEGELADRGTEFFAFVVQQWLRENCIKFRPIDRARPI